MDQSKVKSTVLICEKAYVIKIVMQNNYWEYTPNSPNGIAYLSQYLGDTELSALMSHLRTVFA